MINRLTATMLAGMKREAKTLTREQGSPYNVMLEQIARSRGYSSWHHVLEVRKATTPASTLASPAGNPRAVLLINPVLSPSFDDTPNEERSEEELLTWWMKPFAITLPDGRLEVRCLDGGAWDRSTNYGVADSPAAALELARDKLRRWMGFLEAPRAVLDDGKVVMTVDSLWPDVPRAVLIELGDTGEAAAWLESWERELKEDPSAGRAKILTARRAALVAYGLQHRGFDHLAWVESTQAGG